MANFHWILFISLVLSFEKTLCSSPLPGQCYHMLHSLSCNNVTQDQLDVVSQENFFRNIKITNNSIGLLGPQYLPEKFATHGKSVSLVNNSINAIRVETFEKYQSMFMLNLDNNDLVEIQPHLFSNLYTVDTISIQRNQLKYLKSNAFYNLTNIEGILLNNNAIESIEKKAFSNLPSLLILDLSNNKLDHFPSAAFANVILFRMVMQNNAIEKLNEIENLPTLRNLNLNQNKISSLNDNAFLHTPKLQQLHLSQNAITSFSPKSLALPSKLVTLDLSNNTLSYLNFTEFKEVSPKIDTFNVAFNPWKCQLLPGMVQDAQQSYGGSVYWGQLDYSSTNYQGIPCIL